MGASKKLLIEMRERHMGQSTGMYDQWFILRMNDKQSIFKFKIITMDINNLNFLKDTLKYHGFGEKLFGELEAKMKLVEKDFTLGISTEMQSDKISATLHFRKSNESELYFFNKFEAKLEKAN